MSDVRVRFCPSPTGTPHVGLVRTALFNWAYARHTGGTFVFRIEDTDAARDSEESYQAIIDALTWLGLDWDEGIDVGGPHGPYRQSQRKDIYRDVLAKLLESGEAYEDFSTKEEVEERRRARGENPQLGYDNFDRDLTEEQKEAFRAEGRKPVIRLRMPDEDIAFDDLVRGRVEFKAGSVPDFVIARSNGEPLYTLVNPLDDALMEITHVLRGEDLLSSTPRQIALYGALERIGIGHGAPRFGHLPFVMGEGNRKLSKRDPESDLFIHRDNGFLPEGLLNYLALLGWSISADNEVFTMDEMVKAFDVADVNANPARFDQKKADAINAEHIRLLEPEDFASRLRVYLSARHEEIRPDYPAKDWAFLASLVQTRVKTLGEAWGLVSFLFVDEDDFAIDDRAGRKNLKEAAAPVLDATIAALEALPEEDFRTEKIEEALQSALIDGLELKPRKAYTPVRVAVSGQQVSPPLFESIELLGRDRTLARLRAAREATPWPVEVPQ